MPEKVKDIYPARFNYVTIQVRVACPECGVLGVQGVSVDSVSTFPVYGIGTCIKCEAVFHTRFHRPGAEMIFYAIKHMPTGGYLPIRGVTIERGATWAEPTKIEPPRLFKTAHGAKIALAWWLKGGVEWGWKEGDPGPVKTTTPFPDRKKEDMEIVPIEIA